MLEDVRQGNENEQRGQKNLTKKQDNRVSWCEVRISVQIIFMGIKRVSHSAKVKSQGLNPEQYLL